METTQPGTVEVDFSLAVGRGRLDASLHVPEGDVTLTALLPVLQILSSNIIGSTIGIVEREGLAVSCRVGCAACCRQLVPLSLFEAEALAGWIVSLPAEERRALEARFHNALLALRDSGLLARMEIPAGTGLEFEQQLAIDYLAAKIPCPFLIEESCGIHPIRPFACREYMVTSPPEFCDAPSELRVVGVPVPLKLSRVLFKLGAHLESETRGWIPLVFLFAWMKSGSRPGDAIHGPGPHLLYEVVKRLTA